jgi:hypothetical protein
LFVLKVLLAIASSGMFAANADLCCETVYSPSHTPVIVTIFSPVCGCAADMTRRQEEIKELEHQLAKMLV